MTPAEQVFSLLGLCTQRPGHPEVAGRLRAALGAVPSADDLVERAEEHGLSPLLLAHIREARIAVAPALSMRLFARQVQHSHMAAVRGRLLRETAQALTEAGIPVLVLKGIALARLVYASPMLRPMRDVDLLVRPQDARRAYATLQGLGFAPIGMPVAPTYHHLQGVSKSEDGATITIELHYQLLRRTPFVRALGYDDLRPASQTFECDGLSLQTLGREDMLWHVYAHAFVVNTLCPAARLISIADLVHATEAWVDGLDWEALRQRYGRMVRALPLIEHLSPWSPRVRETLRVRKQRPMAAMSPVSSSLDWTGVASRGVIWPPEWWFRMRYGIDGPAGWLWYRVAGHPLRTAICATETVRTRLAKRFRPDRPHRLLTTAS